MTDALFREDTTLLSCIATVLAVEDTGVVLDRTVFYPQGGGQAGDAGTLSFADAQGRTHTLVVADTRKHPTDAQAVLHLCAASTADDAQQPQALAWAALRQAGLGHTVTASIDAQRRQAHMRFHTATHLLCALVPHPVDGCSITAGYARLDFHMNEPLDKEALTQGIARLVAKAHPVRHRWISEAELEANPGLVRSMSV